MNIQRLAVVCFLSVLFSSALFAGKKPPSPEQKTASLNMTVIRSASGKPVKNAEVVIHLIDNHGKPKQEGRGDEWYPPAGNEPARSSDHAQTT